MTSVPQPLPHATAFRPVRPIGGDLRAFTAMEAPWATLERTVRQADACGLVTEARSDSYAIIDVLDDADDIIGEYGVPDARAWRWWYRRLGCRVADAEGDTA